MKQEAHWLKTMGSSPINNKEAWIMLDENIKRMRKSKGLSQEELAIKLNVVRQTVSKWEKATSDENWW